MNQKKEKLLNSANELNRKHKNNYEKISNWLFTWFWIINLNCV
jgi:hypothetical protein